MGSSSPAGPGTLAAIGGWMDARAGGGWRGPGDLCPPSIPLHPAGRPPVPAPVRLALPQVHLPGLAGRVRFAQFLHDGSEIPAEVIDPGQQAQNTTMSGLGPGVVTLTLPVRQPDVAVPVVELFLEPQR